jgi:Holliday junction resolvase RusA-like endonuclease
MKRIALHFILLYVSEVIIITEGFALFQSVTSDFMCHGTSYVPRKRKKSRQNMTSSWSMAKQDNTFDLNRNDIEGTIVNKRSKNPKNRILNKTTKVKGRSKTNKKDDVAAAATTSSSSGTSLKRKTLQFQEEPEPIHFWANHTDSVIFKDDGAVKMIKFTVNGNPVPLARHRTYRGYVFNPSAKKQHQFASVVLKMLPSSCFLNSTSILGSTIRTPDNVVPIFKDDEIIDVKLLCRMKRPKHHFRNSIPGPGRLKETAPDSLFVTRTDVDNLAKFVLDSLNQIVYVDDKQIASLQVLKIYDDGHYSSGATDVLIQRLTNDHIEQYHGHFQHFTE